MTQARSTLVLFTMLLAAACGGRVMEGDVRICDPDLADAANAASFDQASWIGGDELVRGGMVAHLGRSHPLAGLRPSEVRDLLGPDTCSSLQDDEPCYRVLVGEETRYLTFAIATTGRPIGTVVGVALTSNPAETTACGSY